MVSVEEETKVALRRTLARCLLCHSTNQFALVSSTLSLSLLPSCLAGHTMNEITQGREAFFS